MGWGGIDDPAKILQVLSLDTWTLPVAAEGEASPDHPRLCLRAVLREERGTRRAWSWAGDVSSLRSARKTWSTDSAPCPGDLIVLRGRANYIDLAVITKKGIAGPGTCVSAKGS